MNKIKIGFSSCPNDTFVFDALVNQKIEGNDLSFDITIADVEELNNKAFNMELDVVKVSYHTFLYIADKYDLLNSGSALGNGCGPLLISKEKYEPQQLLSKSIGVPGNFTTANLLLKLAYPWLMNKKYIIFSDIEDAIINKSIDAGVIIHENRFTYQQKQLQCITDLGAWWENTTNQPIPLGGIIIKKSLPHEFKIKIQQNLRKSIQFAFDNPLSSLNFVKKYAQNLEENTIKKHIETYVNQYTLDLGAKGEEAIYCLQSMAIQNNLIEKDNKIEIIKA